MSAWSPRSRPWTSYYRIGSILNRKRVLLSYAGVKHCLGVSGETDFLLMAHIALDAGLGDEVVTILNTRYLHR